MANTALAALIVSVGMILLVCGELFNPEFIAYAFTDNEVDTDSVRSMEPGTMLLPAHYDALIWRSNGSASHREGAQSVCPNVLNASSRLAK